MSRVAVDWRTNSAANYKVFKESHPEQKLTFDEWKNVLNAFSEHFKSYLLETGEKERFPSGLGEFAIHKKKRRRFKGPNDEYINLPIDWKKTKEKGKVIYQMNYHTEGYFFGWHWFKPKTHLKYAELWWFKPTRVTSRLLAHYIHTDKKYMEMYKQWEC